MKYVCFVIVSVNGFDLYTFNLLDEIGTWLGPRPLTCDTSTC